MPQAKSANPQASAAAPDKVADKVVDGKNQNHNQKPAAGVLDKADKEKERAERRAKRERREIEKKEVLEMEKQLREVLDAVQFDRPVVRLGAGRYSFGGSSAAGGNVGK